MSKFRLVFLITVTVIISTFLVFHVAVSYAQSEDPAIVLVAPGDVQVSPDGTAQIAIEIKDVKDAYGFEIKLNYDPNAIEIVDANPSQSGVQVSQGTFFDSGFVIRNVADNENGSLDYAMTQLNPSEAKSGDGVLLVIQIRGKTPDASSPLSITLADVARRDGTKVQTEPKSGEVKVLSDGTPLPTPSPIPTQVPGTPLAEVAPTSTPRNTPTPISSPQPTATPTRTPTQQPTATSVAENTSSTPEMEDHATAAISSQATPAVTESTPTTAPVVAEVSQTDNGASSGGVVTSDAQAPAAPAENATDHSALLYLGFILLTMAVALGVVAAFVWKKSAV